MKYTPEQRIIAFWNKVNKNGSIPTHCPELGNCWEWVAHCHKLGYGTFFYDKKNQQAHRVSWIITNGDIPNELLVLHKCDNPSCVNPSHLFLGTQIDNMRDRSEKGREAHLQGVLNPFHRFTEDQIHYIRNRYAQGNISMSKLAREMDTRKSVIHGIIRFKSWKHI